jgi:hypothetical protein
MIHTEFKGDCMGVRLVQRDRDDKHICFEVLVEDDEVWHTMGGRTSSAWLDELIDVLQKARASMKHHAPDKHEGRQYGWTFK